MATMNPGKLKPIEVVRLMNSTPIGAVINDRQLRRNRDRAGFFFGHVVHDAVRIAQGIEESAAEAVRRLAVA